MSTVWCAVHGSLVTGVLFAGIMPLLGNENDTWALVAMILGALGGATLTLTGLGSVIATYAVNRPWATARLASGAAGALIVLLWRLNTDMPTMPAARTAVHAANLCVAATVAVYPLYHAIRLATDDTDQRINGLWRVLKKTVVMWLVGELLVTACRAYGDAAVTAVTRDPTGAALAGAVAFVVVAVMRMVVIICDHAPRTRGARKSSNATSMAGANATLGVSEQWTEFDNRQAAAHEAGHALLFAAYNSVPDDLVAAIGYDPATSTGGFVGATHVATLITTQTAILWHLHFMLAGVAGEYELTGLETDGAGDDHKRWQALAVRYLIEQSRGTFYVAPSTTLEQQHNTSMLDELRQQQMATLGRLMSANRSVLADLATELGDKKQMDRDELVPFLRRVNLPDEIPRRVV
jgi:hypothetical protein